MSDCTFKALTPAVLSNPIVWDKDFPAETESVVKNFFLTVGIEVPSKMADQLTEEQKFLTALQWAPVKKSSKKQSLPIRQLVLFRGKLNIENGSNMSTDEKGQKARGNRSKLAGPDRQLGS